jgi:serine/threonine protein kinase
LNVGTRYESRYRIADIEFLGERSVLYRAFDEDNGETVALKLARKRNKAPARLENQHPNVVRVRTSGEGEDGCSFEVMDFLEGCTVRELLDEHGSLPYPQALAIVLEAAKGLAHLHSRHLLHRDIKPENLFLATSPRGLSLKIIDLGLALSFRGSARDEDSIPGTPGYVASERMHRRSYDDLSDIYSLGIVLRDLLGESEGAAAKDGGASLAGPPEFLLALEASMTSELANERPSARQVARVIELYLPKTLGVLPTPPQAQRNPARAGETLESIERSPQSELRSPKSRS